MRTLLLILTVALTTTKGFSQSLADEQALSDRLPGVVMLAAMLLFVIIGGYNLFKPKPPKPPNPKQ